MKLILFLVTILIVTSCESQEQDNTKLKNVYSELIDVFKTKDNEKLKNFCYKLAANQTTLDYMMSNYLCYRAIPCEMDKHGIKIKDIGDKFYPNLLSVRNHLISEGLIENLTHLDSMNYKWDILVIVNYTVKGKSIPTSQNDFSFSLDKYNKLLLESDSLGRSFDDYILNGKEGNVFIIKGTEMPMYLKSGNKLIKYPMGEMVFINNKWSLFTKPNTSYTTKEIK